jgi:hypothetical protein
MQHDLMNRLSNKRPEAAAGSTSRTA